MSVPPPIPLSRPSIGEEEAEAAARVVRSGWLAQGAEVAALEEEFGRYLDPADPPHVVATSSGTTALHLALLCAGAKPGVPVVCPSWTFVASANAALYCGAPVELADVDPGTHNLDPARLPVHAVGRAASPHILLAVHQVGLACDLAALRAAAPHAIMVEDAACAVGARYADGTRVGSRRDTLAACFSLHGSKSVVAGEGGLLATRDRHVAERARRLRQHGVDVGAEHRDNARVERYVELGYNHRMTDMAAAVARIQLRKADAIIAARREAAARYSALLQDVAAVPDEIPAGSLHARQRYLLRLRGLAEREGVVAALVAADISCRRGLQAVHRQPYWIARSLCNGGEHLPQTDMLADATIQLPLWAGISIEEQERVVAALRGALR